MKIDLIEGWQGTHVEICKLYIGIVTPTPNSLSQIHFLGDQIPFLRHPKKHAIKG